MNNKDIVDAYKRTLSVPVVARQFGIPESAVSAALSAQGVITGNTFDAVRRQALQGKRPGDFGPNKPKH